MRQILTDRAKRGTLSGEEAEEMTKRAIWSDLPRVIPARPREVLTRTPRPSRAGRARISPDLRWLVFQLGLRVQSSGVLSDHITVGCSDAVSGALGLSIDV